MDRNLAQRVGFALTAIPVALLVVWWGGWLLVALVSVVGVLGTREVYGLLRRGGAVALHAPGLVGAAVVGPGAYLAILAAGRFPDSPSLQGLGAFVAAAWPYLGAVWLMAVMVAALWRRKPTDRPLAVVATTVFGVMYAGALPAFLLDLRHGAVGPRSWTGAWLVFFPLVVTWICDTAAMFAGRAIGGAKLAPVVSPGKTWAGAVAGVIGGLAVAPLFHFAIFPMVGVHSSLGALLAIAGLLSIVGQVGDLAESLFKREAGVKDSSHLIPGHGGVLDRFDSLYFVVPVAAALYRLLGIP